MYIFALILSQTLFDIILNEFLTSTSVIEYDRSESIFVLFGTWFFIRQNINLEKLSFQVFDFSQILALCGASYSSKAYRYLVLFHSI